MSTPAERQRIIEEAQETLREQKRTSQGGRVPTSGPSAKGKESIVTPDSSEDAPSEETTRMEEMLREIARLKKEVENTREKTATLQMAKIPTPDHFYGESSKLDEWLTQLRLKAAGNSQMFGGEGDLIFYALALLRGKALEWARPYIQSEEGYEFGDMIEFEKELRRTFGDPNPTATAERKLYELKQRGHSCAEFRTKFEQIMFTLKWDDKAKISAFREALDFRLKERLIGRTDIPTTYTDYANLCVRIDNEVRAFEQEARQKKGPFKSTYYGGKTGNNNKQGQWVKRDTRTYEHRQPVYRSTAYTGEGAYYGPGPMELGTLQNKNKSGQRNNDKRRDVCYNCNEPGHYSRDCKKPRAPRNTEPRDNRSQQNHRGYRQPANDTQRERRSVNVIQRSEGKKTVETLPTSIDSGEERSILQNQAIVYLTESSDTDRAEALQQLREYKSRKLTTKQDLDKDVARERRLQQQEGWTIGHPRKNEARWEVANPLAKNSTHMIYKRDSSQRLWQTYRIQGNPKERIFNVQTRHIPAVQYDKERTTPTNECTTEYCNYWGKRGNLSRWTFTDKCKRTCTPWQCNQCGKEPQVVTRNSIDCGICGECRSRTEINGIAQRMAKERKTSPCRDLQLAIEDIVLQYFGPQEVERIQRIWNEKYETPLESWCTEEYEPCVEPMYVSRRIDHIEKECNACNEQTATHRTPDGRFFACKNCAEMWTKATGRTEWYAIQSKN